MVDLEHLDLVARGDPLELLIGRCSVRYLGNTYPAHYAKAVYRGKRFFQELNSLADEFVVPRGGAGDVAARTSKARYHALADWVLRYREDDRDFSGVLLHDCCERPEADEDDVGLAVDHLSRKTVVVGWIAFRVPLDELDVRPFTPAEIGEPRAERRPEMRRRFGIGRHEHADAGRLSAGLGKNNPRRNEYCARDSHETATIRWTDPLRQNTPGMSKQAPVIAIDGPSASGKGTIASRVAKQLGFHYLESGALYRLLALIALREGVTDEARLAELAENMDVLFDDGETWLGDEAVTEKVRSEPVGNRASEVARLPAVRQALLKRQRAFRRAPGLVADGRDMATVVFPDAELKVFLTADPEIRAQRRYKQLIEKGIDANLRALSRDLRDRDERDAKRAVAPLVPAPDSQVLDSSALSIDEVVERIVGWWREGSKMGGRP